MEILSMAHSYKLYRSKPENKIGKPLYLKIVSLYLKFLMDKILDGFQVQMSNAHSMGIFAVVGRRMKIQFKADGTPVGLAPDWKATNEYWANNPEAKEKREKLYHTNDHSNGVRYNFVWWKTDMKVGSKYLYSFTFCKPAKRALTKMIKVHEKEYLTN